jgi:hypothetical protein
VPVLLGLVAQIGNEKASKKVMPWVLKLRDDKPRASADEVAAAQAELEAGIVFS